MSLIIGIRTENAAALAADRMISFLEGSIQILGKQQKSAFGQKKDFAIGGTGTVQWISMATAYILNSNLTANMLDDREAFYRFIMKNPKIFMTAAESESGSTADMIFVTRKSIHYVANNGDVVYIDDPFFAIGAGMQYSLGVMKYIKEHYWPQHFKTVEEEKKFITEVAVESLHIAAHYCSSISDPYQPDAQNLPACDIMFLEGAKKLRSKRTHR